MPQELPVLDLGPMRDGAPDAAESLAAELRAAFTEYGFYFVRNHGVPEDLLAETFAAAERFHTMALERKLALKIDEHNIGYLPMRGATTRTSRAARVSAASTNGPPTCPAFAKRS